MRNCEWVFLLSFIITQLYIYENGGNSQKELLLESEEKKMIKQRISSDPIIMNAFQYTNDKHDSYVIDMDAFSSSTNAVAAAAASPNSRTTRSLSRKGSQRGVERKVNGNATTLHDKDNVPATSSPRVHAGGIVGGSCSTPEKGAVVSTDHSMNPHIHHQITIMSGTTTTNTTTNGAENKCIIRRNSFRRVSSWGMDPKRVLLFFATLSSMGTMLLIYFTLTISNQNADDEYYVGNLKH
ncbi:PREDICTED: uncharacterized protein LOC109332647 isoform X2 [Lupinus angustifolius]|uniref:uncharacterized protein LOC109332647 isoform X2 n=1 Tax=Lupinus angustifolius TaxID=3871 RepID=UPI00092F81AB|nr:PREDICTED: uncharacterized protein LOC109332647 isoform X2 [Lupinus angustifolius]